VSVDWNASTVSTRGASAPAPPQQGLFAGYATVYARAPLWRRALAAVLDTVIVAVGVSVAVGVVTGMASNARIAAGGPAGMVVAALVQAITVGGLLGYFGSGWYRGATPGMRALGLVMVDHSTGDLLRTDQVLLRLAGGFWSLVLAPLSVLGAVIARDRRSWADRYGGSAVLHARIEPRWWSWNGAGWLATGQSGVSAAVAVAQPTNRRGAPEPVSSRSRWTWTDVVPIVVLQLPVALLGQFAVVKATRAVGLGRPQASIGSLILDAVGYGMIALLIWLFLRVRRKVSLREIGLGAVRWRWVAAAIPALVAAYTAEIIADEIGTAFLPGSAPNQCHDIRSAYGSSIALALIATAMVAPFVEELLFRGVVFGWMRGRMPVGFAVVGSALVFASAHILYLQWTLLPPVFALGCVLALAYHYSRSLWPGIVIHASINTVATVSVLLGTVHC
jgi:membrane protease YdiL (CAAX protease family)/uncharacterized RDD family membrane protein YckC